MAPECLPAAALRARCPDDRYAFATTAELEPLAGPVGQLRALDALRFGNHARGPGYHTFACGPAGSGRLSLVLAELGREARGRPVPDDWIYVYNFDLKHAPRALHLPAGQGSALAEAMGRLVEDLKTALPAAFGREENRRRQEDIESQFQERQQQAITALSERAAQQGVLLIGTPSGFAFAPMDEQGEAMHPAKFQKLPADEQSRLKSIIEGLQDELQATVRQFPLWFRETRERLKSLNREIAEFVVNHLVGEVKARFPAHAEVLAWLEEIRVDIVEHAPAFLAAAGPLPSGTDPAELESVFQRYAVNLFVDNGALDAAPVVHSDLPTLGNLIGRIEHRATLGTFVTDFTLLKAGALHRANGGFLVLDARQLLMQPFAWEALKRALRASKVALDASETQLGLLTTATLDPTPIPLDVKICLIGERWLLYALEGHDPEFRDLFKVIADFDDEVPRTPDSELAYARLCARLARDAGTRALDRGAVCLLVEHGARLADDAERLSTAEHALADVIREADFCADVTGQATIGADQLREAIARQQRRVGRIRERMLEEIVRGNRLIATDGHAVGQINGLSVFQTDSISFGLPTRITALTRLGDGRVVDIERETELGGAIHSKGVLILSNFLAARYAAGVPLSMSASLVFEQSYGRVDGDSASLAELCALLSSLSGVPIHQRYAVTGSVNQLGEVQAIGGVNEKIEGFFDLCAARGSGGGHGVLIPRANVKHLMLREDIVAACVAGSFDVYAVGGVDEALNLLTSVEAGTRDADDLFPAHSVNGLVEARLLEFSTQRREFVRNHTGQSGAGADD
ncbi:MAG: AAA family ATPase [Gammaproteobacteria bacterium]|nr:AAA family ATPase [Gammaproteobacteria bacterium]